jgi:type II secretory pathway pseudopilin PulG
MHRWAGLPDILDRKDYTSMLEYLNTPSTVGQKGSALLYILIAIMLLGVLTASMVNTSGGSSDKRRAQKLAMEIRAHISQIRNAVIECVSLHSGGDPTYSSANYTHPYPLFPTLAHFTGSTLGAASSNKAGNLRCPGNPGIDNNHEPLFGGSSGKNLQQLTNIFNHDQFLYYNQSFTYASEATIGVYIRNSTNKTDPYIQRAFEMLDAEYSECEFDYIVGDGTNGCASSSFCIRYWLIRKAPACP